MLSIIRFSTRRAGVPGGFRGLPLGALALSMLVGVPGCIGDGVTEPSTQPLAVRVIFPQSRPSDDATQGVASSSLAALQPITKMTARAIELEGNRETVRDSRTISLSPTDSQFQIRLSVPATAGPTEYRVEVEGSGVRETDGINSLFGLLYAGEGFVRLVEEGAQERVDIELVEVVPHLTIDIQADFVALSWTPVQGAIGYRVQQTTAETTETPETTEEFDTNELAMTFRFDTSAEARSYRVRALLDRGRVGAFSEPWGTVAFGQLNLTVVDALSGGPIPGALAQLGTISGTTNESGEARFADLTPRTYPLAVSSVGYVTNTRDVEIVAGLTTVVRVALTKPLGSGYRIILTWGEAPRDIDSHLATPDVEGAPYHVYYLEEGSADAPPYALLDIDDTTGFGPETTTILRSFPGGYHFYVHNWSGQGGADAPLAGSGAQVALYHESTLLTTVSVPATGAGEWWYVLALDAVSGTFTVSNELSDTDPFPDLVPAGDGSNASGKAARSGKISAR